MVKYIISALMLFQLIACKKRSMVSTSPYPDTHDTGAWQYYPLSLGNEWKYRVDSLKHADSSVIKTLGWQTRELISFDEKRQEYILKTNNPKNGGDYIWPWADDTIYNYQNQIVVNRNVIIDKEALNDSPMFNFVWAGNKRMLNCWGQLQTITTPLGTMQAMLVSTQDNKNSISIIHSYYVKGIGLVQEDVHEGLLRPFQQQRFYRRTLYKYFVIRY